MNEYEEISKIKEEKDERIQMMKNKNQELADYRYQCEQDIIKKRDDIVKINEMITDTKQKVLDKEK